MNETGEMQMCFDEMEKLRAKMEALREKRKANEEKRLLNETMMEPNLKVLKTWLDDYKSDIECVNRKATQQMINEKKRYITSNVANIMHSKNNSKMRERMYRNVDFDEIEKMLETSESDSYEVLSKNVLLLNNYQYSNYANKTFITPGKEPKPSEFMENYIEATYNMFNIINKRLDDIEKKT